jgi:CelD/BcsL family acetyltransferase involved in cellulose biosynthesis
MDPAREYADLRARVHTHGVPAGLTDELPGLYSSLPCTQEWLIHHDRVRPEAACVLDDPRHVLLVRVDGDTIEVLNKTFAIAPPDAERACGALFRAFPGTRRIHLEVMFPPSELHVPRRVLNQTDHWVIDLPADVDAYLASLGKSTRRNLRRYEHRLRRAYPELSIRTESGDRSAEYFERFTQWKSQWLASQGRTSMWDTEDDLAEGFVELARARGEIQIVSCAGEEVSIVYSFEVGHSMYGAQAAFRPDMDRYHLGLLSLCWLAGEAMDRGLSELNLMWGTGYYKERLGARPARATGISVFRTQSARLHSLDEGADILLRDLRRLGERYYWRARHRAGAAKTATLERIRSKDKDPDASDDHIQTGIRTR